MWKKYILTLVFITLAISLTSCFQPSPPKAEFLEYKVAGVTAQGIEVNFYFNIENPNPLPVDVSSYSYKIFIEGQELLSEERKGFNIPAQSTKLVKIPILVRYDKVFGSALAVIQRIAQGKDTISFQVEGTVSAGTMGVTFGTPIKAAGNIPLPKDIKI